MTIDEQHVGVEFGFQKVASSQYDSLQPEEIDLALTVAQDKFVRLRLENKKDQVGGFANSQRHLDDIRTLVVKNYKLPASIVQVSDVDYEPNLVRSTLPSNYLYLVSDRSLLSAGCTKPNVPTQSVDEFIHVLKLPESTTRYSVLKLVFNTTTLFDITTTSLAGNVGLEKFELIRLLVESSTSGVSIYWEQYGDFYYPNSIVLVTSTSGVGTLLVDSLTTGIVVRNPQVRYKQTEGTLVQNRLTNPEELHNILRNPFAKSSGRSPVTSLARNQLYGYEGSFAILGFYIDYIRHPRRLSKVDKLNCELASHTHQEIVDLAVEYLQLTTTNPGYGATAQANLTTT